MKPILKSPVGESKLGRGFGINWNNLHMGVDGPVVCELCGTEHPKDEDSTYIISQFLGRKIVETCCGAILDMVYKESGEEFVCAFLEEFAENPTDSRFYCFRNTLERSLLAARKKLEEAGGLVEEMSNILAAIQQDIIDQG